MPSRGDIVLARFPFTDQRGATLRPVLVLAEIPGRYADFLVVFISSRLSQAMGDLDVILDAAHPAFPGSGLRVPSVVRIAKVASISEQLIVGRLGGLDQTILDEITRRLTHVIRTGRPPAGT
ncbi:MAG: PemK family protein [Chloroflexi bacterium]|nr:PemK family protein [Chloroflexota bacterium]